MNGSALLHWLFPNRCACCGRVIYADRRLCDACRNALIQVEGAVPENELPAVTRRPPARRDHGDRDRRRR